MTEKSIGYYLSLPYRVEIYPEPDGSGYTAVIPELPGCMTCADTIEELWHMVEEAKRGWLEVSLEDGDYIPEPAPVEVVEYSGKFVVRIPTSLHCQLVQRAQQEKTSLNQLVVMLLAEEMGRWSARPKAAAARPRTEQGVKPFQRDVFENMRQVFASRFLGQPEQDSERAWQKTSIIVVAPLVA
jgi:antitoxin HicB